MSMNLIIISIKRFLNTNSKRLISTQIQNPYLVKINYFSTNYDKEQLLFIKLRKLRCENSPEFKIVTDNLKHLFNLNVHDAKNLVREHPELKECSVDIINKNYEIFASIGLKKLLILQYPNLLGISDVNQKINKLNRLEVDINLVAPILLAKNSDFDNIIQNALTEKDLVPYKNRIIYISKTLKIPTPEVAYKLLSHLYIFRLQLERLEQNLKILLDYNVDPRKIFNDFWILRYRKDQIITRLQTAIDADVKELKTWMIRCPENVLQRSINREIENRNILGSYSSVEEYLSIRLECSIENAKYLTQKYPALTKKSSLKMKEIMDFLYEEGYTPSHVIRVPRILIHSLDTTKQRLKQLKQTGYTPPSLAILCKSKREYDKMIAKYISRKKNVELQKDKVEQKM